MSLRERIIMLLGLELPGYPVVPWGAVGVSRFLMVRPAGIVLDREAVEVWIVNPRASTVGDPDVSLAETTNTVYGLLRHHLLEPTATPGPPYDPAGKGRSTEHGTMIITGSSPIPLGIG